MHEELKSPCASVSNSDYAYIVESYEQDLYGVAPFKIPALPGTILSPGHTKRLGKCAKLIIQARGDAAALIAAARALAPASGKKHSI